MLYNESEVLHFRLEGDIVSSPGLFTNAITIKFTNVDTSWNPLQSIMQAHKLSNLLLEMTGGEFTGFSWEKSGSSARQDKTDAACLEVTPKNEKHLTVEVTAKSSDMLLFVSTEYIIAVRSPQGNIIYENKYTLLQPSKHLRAASSTFRSVLIENCINNIISAGKAQNFPYVLRQSATAGGLEFCASVVTQKLIDKFDMSAHPAHTIGAASVNVAYQLLHGNKEAALHESFTSVVSAVLQHSTGLPVTFGHTSINSTAPLFGSGVKYASVNREHLSLAVQKAQVGIHFDKGEYIYCKGQDEIHRKYHEVGVHATFPVGGVGLGAQSGYEVSKVKRECNTSGVVTESWWDKHFQGELRLTINAGNRNGSWRLLPAFSSHTVSYQLSYREDGGDLATYKNCPYRIIVVPILQVSQQIELIRLQSQENKTLKNHEDISDVVLNQDNRPSNSRTEHQKFVRKENHTERKYWGLRKKRYTTQDSGGFAEEHQTTRLPTETRESANGKEFVSTLLTRDIVSLYNDHIDKNGHSSHKETVSTDNKQSLTLSSRADGAPYEQRVSTAQLSNGSTVFDSEKDIYILEHDTSLQEKQIITKTTERSVLGDYSHAELSVAQQEGNTIYHKYKSKRGFYKDIRAETSSKFKVEHTQKILGLSFSTKKRPRVRTMAGKKIKFKVEDQTEKSYSTKKQPGEVRTMAGTITEVMLQVTENPGNTSDDVFPSFSSTKTITISDFSTDTVGGEKVGNEREKTLITTESRSGVSVDLRAQDKTLQVNSDGDLLEKEFTEILFQMPTIEQLAPSADAKFNDVKASVVTPDGVHIQKREFDLLKNTVHSESYDTAGSKTHEQETTYIAGKGSVDTKRTAAERDGSQFVRCVETNNQIFHYCDKRSETKTEGAKQTETEFLRGECRKYQGVETFTTKKVEGTIRNRLLLDSTTTTTVRYSHISDETSKVVKTQEAKVVVNGGWLTDSMQTTSVIIEGDQVTTEESASSKLNAGCDRALSIATMEGLNILSLIWKYFTTKDKSAPHLPDVAKQIKEESLKLLVNVGEGYCTGLITSSRNCKQSLCWNSLGSISYSYRYIYSQFNFQKFF